MKVSLIITTYNWTEALAVTLHSVLQQTYGYFEIVIADDGSSSQTADTVKQILGPSQTPWCHVRQADNGIRQARIKNLAVKYANGDYYIFIDHDVALHPEFIKDHVNSITAGCFLQGKRVFLSSKLTDQFLSKGRFHPLSPWAPGLENRKNAFRSPALGGLLGFKKKFQVTLRGCNLSMTRSTFMHVDGYDEVFDGLWGREDSDICYRLFHAGLRIVTLWFTALQYHLQHEITAN